MPSLRTAPSLALLASALVSLLASAPSHAVDDAYYPPPGSGGAPYGDAYRPNSAGGPYAAAPESDAYQPEPAYEPGAEPGRSDSFGGSSNTVPAPGGYGEPYYEPNGPAGPEGGYPEPQSPQQAGAYEQNEIIDAGHKFFGSVSQGIAQGVEYVFKSQGRPNGYILGEDAGGAFVVGLRYGEGMLFTKNAGNHKTFWQGPSVGYDAGAEGSKVMVLVYNLHDPSEIYHRFGGVQGSAYFVGGVGVQLQKHGDVTLAVIRSGVGVRLGANVGYMKYTRTPTWNPL